MVFYYKEIHRHILNHIKLVSSKALWVLLYIPKKFSQQKPQVMV